MNIVYILGTGSTWNDNELRYSLRSLQNFFPGEKKNVYIVGHCPEWVKGVTIIRSEDNGRCKEENIFLKLLLACDELEEFYYFNDDHIVTSEVYKMALYHNGPLINLTHKIDSFIPYRCSIDNTINALKNRKIDIDRMLNFDIHVPMFIDKTFKEIMLKFSWDVKHGYIIKSLYANHMQIKKAEFMEDFKYLGEPLEENQLKEIFKSRKFISFADRGLNKVMKKVLNESFPATSKYEII